MKIKIKISIIYLLCVLSCNQDKKIISNIGTNTNLHVIDIDKAEKVERMFLSEICYQVKTIILETNDDVLIGNSSYVQVYNDFIFVLDRSTNMGLFAFNKEGAFIRKYGNRGIGPSDYLSINDFTIDTDNDLIYLLDNHVPQILIYQLSTGKYVNKIRLEENRSNYSHIQYNNGKLYTDIEYWDFSEENYLIQEIDISTGKQKQCFLDTKRYNKNWPGRVERGEESFFYARNQDACKFVHICMDTIISIGKDQIETFAVLREKDWVTSAGLARIIDDNRYDPSLIYWKVKEKGFTFDIHNYAEWKNYIFFRYINDWDKFCVFHNIKTGKTRLVQYLLNDLVHDKTIYQSSFCCFDEAGLYEIISTRLMDRFIERINTEENFLKKDLDKYEELMNLPEDSNPIIFYYKLK